MEKNKTKKIFWIVLIVLAILFIGTLILVGYEHIISPTEPIGMKITNLFLISIPLILLYGSIGLVLTAIRQKEVNGKIKPGLFKISVLHAQNCWNSDDYLRVFVCPGCIHRRWKILGTIAWFYDSYCSCHSSGDPDGLRLA